MQTFATFEDIEAWKMARILTRQVYAMTATAAIKKDYALSDQIRRAAVSVQANIAEGSERDGRLEFARYLLIARGSAGEIRSHLYVALDTGLITEEEFHELYQRAWRITKMLGNLIVFLRRSGPARQQRS